MCLQWFKSIRVVDQHLTFYSYEYDIESCHGWHSFVSHFDVFSHIYVEQILFVTVGWQVIIELVFMPR